VVTAPLWSETREKIYTSVVQVLPFIAGPLVIHPYDRESIPGFAFVYLSFLLPLLLWRFTVTTLVKVTKNPASTEWRKRLTFIFVAIIAILIVGFVQYRFKHIDHWFEIFLLMIGVTSISLFTNSEQFPVRKRAVVFLEKFLITFLGISTLLGSLQVIPIVISVTIALGSLAVHLASEAASSEGLPSKGFRALFGMSLLLPPVLLGFLSILGILPPPVGLILFTVPFIAKPHEMLAVTGSRPTLVKDTAAAFLLFVASGIFFAASWILYTG
jgi:hypothetical protein